MLPCWGPLPSTRGLPCTATLAFCTAEGPATRMGPLVLLVASPGSPYPAHSLLPPAGTAHKWAMSHLPPSLHRSPLMSLFCGFRVHPAPRLLKGFPPLLSILSLIPPLTCQSIRPPPLPPALSSNPRTLTSLTDHLTPQSHGVISDPSLQSHTHTHNSLACVLSWRSPCPPPASLTPHLVSEEGG